MTTTSTGALIRATITDIVASLMKTVGEVELQCNTDTSDLDCLDSGIEALNTCQRSVASLITNLARRRNLLLPIHRLPDEIFVRILQIATGFNQDSWHAKPSVFHKMVQVSVHWRNIILSTSSFWRVVADDQDERLQDAVLRLSGNSPLVVWTRMSDYQLPDAFLERMIPLAHRWQILIVERPYSDQAFAYLPYIPPTLKDLCLVVFGTDETYRFQLAEGHPLRHVDLVRVSIPWDSSRLRNLQTLSLDHQYTHQPTLGQIVSILLSSPHLWRLIFRKWERSPPLDYLDGLERYADTVIPLPLLTTLVADSVPTVLVDFLIHHTQTTALSCLIANIVQSPNTLKVIYPRSTLFDMVKQILSPRIETTSMIYDDNEGIARIQSNLRPRRSIEMVYWAEDAPGVEIGFSIRVGDSCGSIWQVLADVLAANAPCTRFDFVNHRAIEPSDIWVPHLFPLALLPHLPRIDTITFDKGFNAGPILRHLGSPGRTVDGTTLWPCPELTTAEVREAYSDDTDVIVTDVMEFIQRRYLQGWAENGGPPVNGAGVRRGDADQGGPSTSLEDDEPKEEGRANPAAIEGGTNTKESEHDGSSSRTGRYPAPLKKLLLPLEVVEKLREVEGMQRLEERGVMVTR